MGSFADLKRRELRETEAEVWVKKVLLKDGRNNTAHLTVNGNDPAEDNQWRDVTKQQQAGARQNHSDSEESGSEDWQST